MRPVCNTKQEWDDYAHKFRNTIERGQTIAFKFSPGSGGSPQ